MPDALGLYALGTRFKRAEQMTSILIPLTESQFQRQVTDLADRLGWQWLHIERMGNDQGRWRTPAGGPLGKGWPDLVLVRGGRTVYAELKAQRGVLTDPQRHVLQLLRETSAHVYVWRPSDFPQIIEVLSK